MFFECKTITIYLDLLKFVPKFCKSTYSKNQYICTQTMCLTIFVVEMIPLQIVSVEGIHCPSDPHETVLLITSWYPVLQLTLHDCPG